MKNNIIFLSATSFAFNEYLEDFLIRVAAKDNLHLVANCEDGLKDFNGVVHHFTFQRGILKIKELILIKPLLETFRTINPSIVYSISPKGGLFVLLLCFVMRKNFVWVHIYTGQVWYNKKGLMRILLRNIDTLIGRFTDKRLIDSDSQRSFLIEEKVITEHNSFVLGPGSIKGNKVFSWEHCEISTGMNLLFVGRANKEKGFDLILKFVKKNREWLQSRKVSLKIAGLIEDRYIQKELEALDHVEYLGYVTNLKELFLDTRVLLIPSEREGFGSVVVEAGIYGVPSIGTDIIGLRDSLGDFSFKMDSNDYNEFERLIIEAYEEDAVLWAQRARSRQAECEVFYRDKMVSYYYDFHLSLSRDHK